MAERARCEICNLDFKDADGLAQHQAAKHAQHPHHTPTHHHISSSPSTTLPKYSGKKTYLLIAGIFIIIALFFYFKGSPNDDVIINMTEVIGTGRPTIGNANAPVTIVEFSDFQCTHCATFAKQEFPQLKREYIDTGKVKFIFRNFPIYQVHPQAMQAAEAALCIYQQENITGYMTYSEKLFTNAESLTTEILNTLAQEQGVNISSCLDSHQFRNDVLKDMEDGSKAGVKGTPSFVINGKFIEGVLPYQEFKKIIDSA